MTEPVWILRPALLAVHSMLMNRFGGLDGPVDCDIMDSALSKPRNHYLYEKCNDLHMLAALYADGIVRNHPFTDGNKRTAFMAAYIFLARNNINLQSDEASVVTMTRSLAASEIQTKDYANWLSKNSNQ